MNFLDIAKRRYSCREFDGKDVSEADMKTILNAGLLAPSSLGLEPWEFWVVKGKKLETLKECCNSKRQFETCSFAVLILSYQDFSPQSDYVQKALKRREDYERVSKLYSPFLERVKGDLALKYGSEQAHLACMNLVNAAASINVDSCIIGGFEPSCVREKFAIPKELFCALILTFGYQKEEPKREKTRFSFEEKVKFL